MACTLVIESSLHSLLVCCGACMCGVCGVYVFVLCVCGVCMRYESVGIYLCVIKYVLLSVYVLWCVCVYVCYDVCVCVCCGVCVR